MTKKYACLTSSQFADDKGYKIVAIREQDIENIRIWRNAQIDVLRQKIPLSQEDQRAYFQRHIWPSFQNPNPEQILFSFLYQDACIGYGGLTRIDWEARRAEVSFLVDPLRAQDPVLYARDYTQFLFLLSLAAFKDLQFHRLYAETFAFRLEHMRILEECGFKQEGILREHIYKRGQWWDSLIHGLLAKEFVI